ncbi:NUDIX domain-containing protein [Actinoallomurus acaciae]|uniref:NUDIX domain-containing protein n=1 Tax=Actinoallomurus acaciae TaxID=502577 RepID=A0ABV5Y934_9ACTN
MRCSAIVFRGDEVLLLHRARDGGDWVLPGGCPRPGEGLAACARREVLEETGIRAEIDRVAFALEAIDPDGADRTIEIVLLAADVPAAAAVEATEAGLEPGFVRLDALPELNLRPPIAGHLRGLRTRLPLTAAYLGNLWRPPRRRHRRTAATRRLPAVPVGTYSPYRSGRTSQ